MLAFEPKEPGIMERLPRNPHAPILSRPLFMRMGLVSALLLLAAFGMFMWMEERVGLEEARTAAVNIFVFGELFYVFNRRSLTRSMFRTGLFSNRAVIGGVLAMTVLQLLFTYTPAMNRLFGSAPLAWGTWAAILVFGLMLYAIVEVEKQWRGHVLQGETAKPRAASSRSESPVTWRPSPYRKHDS
jgi:cation-transporting ATPase F